MKSAITTRRAWRRSYPLAPRATPVHARGMTRQPTVAGAQGAGDSRAPFGPSSRYARLGAGCPKPLDDLSLRPRAMRIHHLQVHHFRGIEHLDWKVRGNFVCLVGPGDSTKSTVLDAIEFALLPRWNPSFDDTDFNGTDTSKPISITVTVGDLPPRVHGRGPVRFGTSRVERDRWAS